MIDPIYLKRVLAELLATPSVTGHTEAIVVRLTEILQELGPKCTFPRKGGVQVFLPGRGPMVLVTGHLDTLGAMVKEIHSDGTLSFVKVGGFMFPSIEGENCTVLTRKERKISGTIFTTEPSVHIFDEPDKLERKLKNFRIYLDEPTNDAEASKALGIQVGDFVAFDPRSQFLANGFIKSRHLDDKAGSACMLATLKAVQEIPQHRPVVFYWTIYEEVGHGAATGIGEAVEEILSVDIGLVGTGQTSSEMAVTICAKDSFSPYDYQLTNALVRIAENQEIPHRLDVFPHYGSDASVALSAGHDLRAGLIGPGVFATHFYERTHQEGLLHTAELLLAYLADIPA